MLSKWPIAWRLRAAILVSFNALMICRGQIEEESSSTIFMANRLVFFLHLIINNKLKEYNFRLLKGDIKTAEEDEDSESRGKRTFIDLDNVLLIFVKSKKIKKSNKFLMN